MLWRDDDAVRDWLTTLPMVDNGALRRLEILVSLLKEENDRQNLVSATSLAKVWTRHIADSAQLLRFVPRETWGEAGGDMGAAGAGEAVHQAIWLDLGTGAGFPGLVVSALRPDIPMRLVESRARRITWLREAILVLGLPHVQVFGARLETLPSFAASVISARAFAPLERMLSLSSRFSTAQTLWLLPKGRSGSQELSNLSTWRHRLHAEVSLTDDKSSVIVGKLLGRAGI